MKPSELHLLKQKLPVSEAFIRRNLDSRPAHPLQNPQPKPPVLNEPARADARKEKRPTRVKVRVISYRRRLLDIDNLAGGGKFIVDALRYQGFIHNDSPDAIDLHFSQMKVSQREREETVVIIEHIPEIDAQTAAQIYGHAYQELTNSNR